MGFRSAAKVLVLAFTVVIASANVVSAVGTIGGRPALPREDEPRSSSIFLHTINPGEAIDEKVVVQNSSDEEQTIVLYGVDAIPSSTGAFTCKQRVEKAEGAGTWLDLAQDEVTLKPKKATIVDFTITAPKNADVGEHNACIVFENKQDSGAANGNIIIRSRSAIRVALTIPGELNRNIEITSFNVASQSDIQLYTLVLSNIGNVSADISSKVHLQTLFGETVFENGGEYPVLAGEKHELVFRNEQTPFFGGWYVANASITYDRNATTWGTNQAKDPVTLTSDKKLIFMWPQPLALIILIVGLIAAGLAVYYPLKERSKRKLALKSWSRFTITESDTLQSLAKKSGISWKQIVKINQIKPPYGLRVGSAIYLPDKTPKSKHTKKKRT